MTMDHRFKAIALAAAVALALAQGPLAAAPSPEQPCRGFADGNGVYVLRDGEVFFWLSYPLWGPRWAWSGYQAEPAGGEGADGFRLRSTLAASGAEIELNVAPRQSGPRQITLDYRFRASKNTALTLACIALGPRYGLRDGGKAVVVAADGTRSARAIPFGRQLLGAAVAGIELVGRDGAVTSLRFDPPTEVQADGDARIVLAREQASPETPVALTLVIDLPGPVSFHPSPGAVPEDPGMAAWFPWEPAPELPAASVIGMEDWLERPAGASGRIRRVGDRLLAGDRPVRLWGLNLCYSACSPPRELADRRARLYARYGINAVRLHKYADGPGWAGIQAPESFAAFDPEALDRMDYQVARFREHGIYVKLSPTFGTLSLGSADLERVPYASEFGNPPDRKAGRVKTAHGSIYFGRELQDLQIRQIVALLQHRNPYTGITYAEDPGVAFLEIVNEHSAMFYSSLNALQRYPSLRRQAAERFCAWLEERYGGEAEMLAAWGPRALNSFTAEGFTGESLAAGTIVPAGQAWFFDPDQLAGSQAFRRQRLLDTMHFLYDLQNDFYDRTVEAAREAGYAGEVVASNWQAGRAFSHYLNLHSDARIGTVDRHNYFGGTQEGWIHNATMLRKPGSGLLSAGLQQVADRPFMLSEWIHNFPNEWGVEGPALLGAYGMGLQGWDVSFMFQNRDNGTFSDRVGRETWDVTVPHILGAFPAIARQVLRGDVAEGTPAFSRAVHVPALWEGRLGFEETVQQDYDVKSFGGTTVPALALAATRVVVAFTDAERATAAFAPEEFLDGEAVVASTGQLRWQPGRSALDGHVTLNTPGTKAVIGFAPGETCRLGEVTIRPLSPFAAIYVTALGKEGNVASARALLVTAVARARNTGMRILWDRFLIDRGREPIRMEPVKAAVEVRRPGRARVTVLDHDGCRTDRRVPVEDATFLIDGEQHRTIYYLVEFD
ncbi:MAG: hypothetical protein JXR77_10065 [Lentisphaeria bacterium]|nr:hypothetical protein [Lentisphaeria bacterium]